MMTVYDSYAEEIDGEVYIEWHEIDFHWEDYDTWFDALGWCQANCEYDVIFDDLVYFEDEYDAVAFKLRWL